MAKHAKPVWQVVIKGTFIALSVCLSFQPVFAQESVWIDSFTVDDVPLGDNLMALAELTSRRPETKTTWNDWISKLWRGVSGRLGRRPAHATTVVNLDGFAGRHSADSGLPIRTRRLLAFGRAPSPPATALLRCAGGATSGNPDADIDVFIEIWLESSRVAFAQARGYMPSTVAQANVETVGYDRPVACYAYAGSVTATASGTLQGTVVPTGETTASGGWWTQNTSVHLWNQTLTGGTFRGRRVWEEDPGGGGPDTCWFPGSPFSKFEAISTPGYTWEVGTDNNWGPDAVGWSYDQVSYYRGQSRDPCETRFSQDMYINPLSSPVKYLTNVLRAGITSISVWSERAGQYQERIWP